MAFSLTRWTIRAALALPTPILRAFSGGAAVVRDGRTLDPHFQFLFHAVLPGLAGPPGTVEDERALVSRAVDIVGATLEPGVKVEDFSLPGPDGLLAVRAYRPQRIDPAAPLLVYAHGGGGVVGDLETSHAACSVIAAVAGCAVLSVDYRLAPEHRFPAGLEDVAAAWRWACDAAEQFGSRPGPAAIGGEGIGANFAAVLCQEIKRMNGRQPALQLLICPTLDLASELPPSHLHGDGQMGGAQRTRWAQGHYLGAQTDPADLRLSPLKSADVGGLAPAVIATAGFDPMAGQGEAYARALQSAGSPVTYRRHDALPHGFVVFGVVPGVQTALRQTAELVRLAFERSAQI
jgi:acetyl esterase